MTHVMLDLETLGTNKKSPILTLALVEFVPSTGVRRKERYWKINPLCYDRYKDLFSMDYSTLLWWQSQNEEAKKNSLSEGGDDIKKVVEEVCDFVRKLSGIVFVWSQGIDFDIPILSNAIEALGFEIPWKFWNVRDSRTLLWFKGIKLVEDENHPSHHALGDCYKQIEGIRKCYL